LVRQFDQKKLSLQKNHEQRVLKYYHQISLDQGLAVLHQRLLLIVSHTNALKWLAELFSDLEQAANNKPPIYKLIMFLDISHTPS